MTQSFEELPASVQQLTFESIESFLRNSFGNRRPELSDLLDADGRYTNYAYALSDQNPWHTEIHFEGGVEIIDGPIIRQIDDAVDAITVHNPAVEIKKRGGMHRRFPSAAIREALVNSVIHSDL